MRYEFTEHIWKHNRNPISHVITSSTCERCGTTFFYERLDRLQAPTICHATPQWLQQQKRIDNHE